MFRSAAKETLAFGHVLETFLFSQCISQERSKTTCSLWCLCVVKGL